MSMKKDNCDLTIATIIVAIGIIIFSLKPIQI